MIITDDILMKFNQIGEADYPIVKIDDTYYTPKMLYNQHVEFVLPVTPDYEVLEKRAEMKYNQGKIHDTYTPNGLITPDMYITEIRFMTRAGIGFLNMEQGLIDELLQRPQFLSAKMKE